MDATLKETMGQVSNEIDSENVSADTNVDSSATQNVSQEQEMNQALEKDEEFQRTVPKEFNRHPVWRKLYYKAKEAERKAKEYEPFKSRAEELEEMLSAMENRQQETEVSPNKNLTPQEEANLQKLLDGVQRPEDRTWLKNYADGIKSEYQKDFEKNYGEKLAKLDRLETEYRLDKSEQRARKLVEETNKKYGLTIDYDKDIDPELSKMVSDARRRGIDIGPHNTDLFLLTKEFFANKGIEFGKKLSEQQMMKLNEDKKKAAVENSATVGSPTVDDSKSSLKDIWNDVNRKEGSF